MLLYYEYAAKLVYILHICKMYTDFFSFFCIFIPNTVGNSSQERGQETNMAARTERAAIVVVGFERAATDCLTQWTMVKMLSNGYRVEWGNGYQFIPCSVPLIA